MNRLSFKHFFMKPALAFVVLAAGMSALLHTPAQAQDLEPNAMVEQVTQAVLVELKNNQQLRAGNETAAREAINRVVMPHINFRRMTASAVGPAWRNANAEQREQLVEAFETMLIRTYAGSLEQVGDLSVVILPQRAEPADAKDVLVRSEVRGGNSPIQLDYRLEKTPGQGLGWKIYNVNVLGAWVVNTYREQFAQPLNAGGIDGLIKALKEQNFKAAQPATQG